MFYSLNFLEKSLMSLAAVIYNLI